MVSLNICIFMQEGCATLWCTSMRACLRACCLTLIHEVRVRACVRLSWQTC